MKKIHLVLLFTLSSSILTYTSNAQYKILHSFNGAAGAFPSGGLTLTGSKLYGMAGDGGANGIGCIFAIDTNGNNYRDIFDFNGTNGAYPSGTLVISGNKMYGMMPTGGLNDSGCVFSIDTNGKGYKDLLDFNGTNGSLPQGSIVLSAINKLYGMAIQGGAYQYGCIFSIDTGGGAYKDLFDFNGTNGANPYGQVTIIKQKLYGMTDDGGANFWGNVFSLDTNGTAFNDLFDFDYTNGGNPNNILTPSASGSQLFGMANQGGANEVGNVFSVDTNGMYFKDIVDFDSAFNNPQIGAFPWGDLALSGKVLFGMTSEGGVNDSGCIFSVDSIGNNYKVLLDFNGTNGSTPFSNLTISGSKLYGMTYAGGANNYGVIFRIDTNAKSTASVNEVTTSHGSINVYPNPNNGAFTIQSGMLSGAETSVEIYNVLGEKVYSSVTPTQPPPGGGGVSVSYNSTISYGKNISYNINLSSQPNGVYFYRVISKNGETMGSGKVIIDK